MWFGATDSRGDPKLVGRPWYDCWFGTASRPVAPAPEGDFLRIASTLAAEQAARRETAGMWRGRP